MEATPLLIPFHIAKEWRISHLQLASKAGDMEKILVAGTAVGAKGEGGREKVEDKEEKEKTHFDPGHLGKDFDPGLVGKGIQQ